MMFQGRERRIICRMLDAERYDMVGGGARNAGVWKCVCAVPSAQGKQEERGECLKLKVGSRRVGKTIQVCCGDKKKWLFHFFRKIKGGIIAWRSQGLQSTRAR